MNQKQGQTTISPIKSPSQPDASSPKKKTLDDYEFVALHNGKTKTNELGTEAFGTVKRVREKATGHIYALKIMSKSNIFRYSNKENLKREITIQRSLSHPNIIQLYHCFEDNANVYIVLEYAENGNLFETIRKKRRCSESEAFKFLFQTALALDYLHGRDVVHRDIKPENLLLDKNGNIKLCDFGWCTELKRNEKGKPSYCGTVDYMAPEIIKNISYDHSIDVWSLGVLLYEMLHGYAPYCGKTEQQKLHNISKNTPFHLNESLSPEALDLIKKILQPTPENRITLDGIFRHPWMTKFGKTNKIEVMTIVIKQQQQQLQKEDSQSQVSLENQSPRKELEEKESPVEINNKKESGISKLEEKTMMAIEKIKSFLSISKLPSETDNLFVQPTISTGTMSTDADSSPVSGLSAQLNMIKASSGQMPYDSKKTSVDLCEGDDLNKITVELNANYIKFMQPVRQLPFAQDKSRKNREETTDKEIENKRARSAERTAAPKQDANSSALDLEVNKSFDMKERSGSFDLGRSGTFNPKKFLKAHLKAKSNVEVQPVRVRLYNSITV